MIDIHVHYFPERVFKAIWDYFESRGHGLWSIHYKLHGQAHLEELERQGVTRATTLVYAHKKHMADYLNDFVAEACAAHRMLIPFGTVFAGDGNVARTASRIFEEQQFKGIKLHPFVSNEQVDDPRLFPMYEAMQALDKVLICHTGSGPAYAATDGAQRLGRVLSQFPGLKVVAAHCGAFEYTEYQDLADAHPNLHFDTAMNCVHTQVFTRNCPGRAFFERFAERILFGSDYPNIPYPYEEQVQAIQALRLGEQAEAALFEDNASRLLGL